MIILDTNDDAHIIQNDINVTLTYAEHELICDILMHASSSFDFTCPYGIYDLPIESEIVQRYTVIENLRERFATLWCDRFDDPRE
jgi:hypothetical protein